MTFTETYDGPIYDVHTHYVPQWWYDSVPGASAPSHAEVSNLDAVLVRTRDGHGSRRVIGVSVEILYGATQSVDYGALRRLNASLAEAADEHPDTLLALATVDPFEGERSAAEVHHAISELGLSGIILDAVRGGKIVGQPETIPTLEAAAELGVPVLVHPVWTPDVAEISAVAGPKASAWGRGYESGLALLQLLHAGVLSSIPELDLIFTALGVGALYFADEGLRAVEAAGPAATVYHDTTTLHPASIRYSIDVLGEDRVIIGTDWPFHDDNRPEVLEAVAQVGVSEEAAQALLHRNFERVFAKSLTLEGTRA